jgi:uncharacterized membrane protein YdjX (TVP38/TMEM64 family)
MTRFGRLARTVDTRVVRRAQLGIVLGLGAALAGAYLFNADVQAEMGHALTVLGSGDGRAVGDYLLSFGVWAPIASLFLMVLQAVAAPIPAIFVAFANGLAFGVVGGGILTTAGQTLAAALCFGISRALGRGPVEALAGRFGLVATDTWFSRWGARGVLLLRLVPGVSFDVISYGAGLTSIRFGPFLLATAIGVAPQAFLYAYLIREAPQSAWVFYAVSWLVIGVIGSAAFLRRKPRAATPVPERDAQPECAPAAGPCKAI